MPQCPLCLGVFNDFRAHVCPSERDVFGPSDAAPEPEQEDCGTTHYVGCACHEQGWENKWKRAVEMAARAEMERDELRSILYQVSTGGYTPMAAHEWLKSNPENDNNPATGSK